MKFKWQLDFLHCTASDFNSVEVLYGVTSMVFETPIWDVRETSISCCEVKSVILWDLKHTVSHFTARGNIQKRHWQMLTLHWDSRGMLKADGKQFTNPKTTFCNVQNL